MSASEKLKALEAASRPHVDEVVAEQEARLTQYVREVTGDSSLTVEAGSPMLSIARALPQIVAVASAVERLLRESDEGGVPEVGEFPLDAWLDLVEANRALDEALS